MHVCVCVCMCTPQPKLPLAEMDADGVPVRAHVSMPSAAQPSLATSTIDRGKFVSPPATPFQFAQPIPMESAVTFYFVVFLCNRSPIFHSNRIPLRDDTPPYTPGDIVYFGPSDEVAQQKLQELAFPLGFGCKSSLTRNGPLWNSRLESVQKRGKVRYHRLMIASTFVVSVALESGELRTMQTKYAAVALVVTCPADRPYREFLEENFDAVVRNMLHVVLNFAMKATQLFFFRLSPTTVVGELVTELERDPQAIQTYGTLGAILVNAFAHSHAIPRLHSRMLDTNVFNLSCSSSSQPRNTTETVGDLLSGALRVLCSFSETFTSRFIAGLLSLSNWERWGSGQSNMDPQQQGHCTGDDGDRIDIYGDYWNRMEMVERSSSGSGDNINISGLLSPVLERCQNIGNNNNNNNITSSYSYTESIAATAGAQVLHRLDFNSVSRTTSAVSTIAHSTAPITDVVCSLSSERVGRVVIFCTDPELARCLLILAAFFFRDHRATVGMSSRLCDKTPFAGKVLSCIYPSFPVQWVMEEYDETRVDRLLSFPYSVDNLLLVIAPRVGVCNRIKLEKKFSLTPILVEKFKKGFHPVCPFQQRTLSVVKMLPDKTVSSTLRESQRLQEKSHGTVNCAVFFEFFMLWLVRQSQLCYLQQRFSEVEATSLSVAYTPLKVEGSTHVSSRIGSHVTKLFSFFSRSNGDVVDRRCFPHRVSPAAASPSIDVSTTAHPTRVPSDNGSDGMFGCVQENSQLMGLLTECWTSSRDGS
ncbi:hypothetical protein MOQ_005174 [Trypanosoma cruzi marinkellei]|uniref:Uncharacterized protein n=1 Tax=Trypanosoma cruzi marinkellei TaxID=85056 RepID=K2MV68_TRYCR|nr:hypothetical protein MOQ_005174 [Trypanosoma cruzi marinkellei]